MRVTKLANTIVFEIDSPELVSYLSVDEVSDVSLYFMARNFGTVGVKTSLEELKALIANM